MKFARAFIREIEMRPGECARAPDRRNKKFVRTKGSCPRGISRTPPPLSPLRLSTVIKSKQLYGPHKYVYGKTSSNLQFSSRATRSTRASCKPVKNAAGLGFFAWIIEPEEETPFVKLMEEIVLIMAVALSLFFFCFQRLSNPLSYVRVVNGEVNEKRI